MPTVPTYDNLRVATSDAPMPGFQPASGPSAGQIAGQQLQQAGAGLESAGGVAGRIAADIQQQANDLRVNDAMNQYMAAQTNARVEVLQLKGKNALERPDNKSLPDEYGEKLDQVASGISEKLGNSAQRQAFTIAAQRQGIQFRSAVSSHMVQQADVYRKETQKASLDLNAQRGGMLWGDTKVVAQSAANISLIVDDIAKDHGMSADAKAMALVDALTPLHAGVMKGMLSAGKATDAKEYFEAHSAEMTLQARVAMQDTLKGAVVAEVAQTKGADIAGRYSYTETSAAIKEIDALTLPPEQKAAIRAEVEHRHAVQQSDANGNNALLVGKLDTMVQQGMSLATIQATPEFQGVRDKGTVLKLIRERTEHAVSLQAAVESRDYTKVQRLRAEQEYKGQVAMFAYSDPMVLASMKREDIAGMALSLGPGNTQHLLEKWDTFARSESKLRVAKIDDDQFKTLADGMGLKPYADTGEDAKRQLVSAKNRVEEGIAEWQTKHGAEMPREEKGKLMQREIGTEILIKGRHWGTNTTNLLQVQTKDAARVVVPEIDRGQIIAKARRELGRPDYTPTDAEIGTAYLKMKTRAAANGQ